MTRETNHDVITFDAIGFDADDTLWHDIPTYSRMRHKFDLLLARYPSPEWVERRLYETEMRNLRHFGYGIKGFTLSLIETAVEVTAGEISGREIQGIIDECKQMTTVPLELIDHARETIDALSPRYDLLLITKGDLLDQETKLARSGLGRHFKHVDVVSEKTPETYDRVLRTHGIAPARFLMVGNSLRSDVLPPLAIGSRAVHVPYPTTWLHEHVSAADREKHDFLEIEDLGQLPGLLEDLSAGRRPRARVGRATEVWGGAPANGGEGAR